MTEQPPSAADLLTAVSNSIAQREAAARKGLQPSNWLWALAHHPDAVLQRCTADRKLLELHGGRGHSCPAYDADGDLDEHARFYDHEVCPVVEQLAAGYGLSQAAGQVECGWNPADATTDCEAAHPAEERP